MPFLGGGVGWGGGGGGAEESFPVRFINVTFQIIKLLQISLLICNVSPFSNQVFRRFFSMDNLRGYGEDDTLGSACLGPSSKELPSPSAGTAPPLGTQLLLWRARRPPSCLLRQGRFLRSRPSLGPLGRVHRTVWPLPQATRMTYFLLLPRRSPTRTSWPV